MSARPQRFVRACLVLGCLLSANATLAVDSISAEALFKGTAVLSIDGKRRTLKTGQTSPEGVTLVFADSRKAVVEVNGRHQKIPLGERIAGHFSAPPKGTVHRVFADRQGMYITDGTINGHSTKMLIDTGATLIAINKPTAKRLGLDYLVDGQPTQVSTASGTERAYYVQLRSVRIGGIEQYDVDAVVIDSPYPEIVLLGNSFLGRLKTQRDGAILELREK